MKTTPPKILKQAVLEFLDSSTVLKGLLGTVDVADVSEGTSGGSVLVVKYNRHLLTLRYNEAESAFDFLDVDYNMFELEMSRGSWRLPTVGLIVVRKINSFQTYRLVDDKWKRYVAHVNNRSYEELFLGKFNKKDSLLDALVRDGSGWRFLSYKDWGWIVQSIAFPSEWTLPESNVQVLTSFDADYSVFVLRTANGLRVYKINVLQKLECIVKCAHVKLPEDPKFERIAFANFSNTVYKDMLHFSSIGLNVYRFQDKTKSYEPLHYSTMFSELRNWNGDYVNSLIVHDIDDDGVDELLFTGPSGLQAFRKAEDDDEFYLEDVVLKSANDIHRFMALMTFLPKQENGTLGAVFYDDSKLRLMHVRNDSYTITMQPDVEPKEKAEAQISLITPAANYTRWLHEQLDLSELLQPVNSLTGKVELSIPLVQLDNPFGISVRKVFQYRDMQGDGYLARGWSFPLDYITVDQRGSIFEEDFRYAIVKQSRQVTLVQNFEKSSNEVVYFEVQSELVLRYFKQHQRWEMKNKEESMTYIFGKHNSSEALQYAEHDEGRESPIAWYLIREEDASSSFVQYEYEIVKDNVHLEKITTDLGSSVRFDYDNGQMHGFTVQTQFYKQVVDLDYLCVEDNESKTFLAEIKQDGNTFFEFQYDSNSDRMMKIVYPNGLKSTLEYKSLEIDWKIPNELELIGEDMNVHYGPDYSIIVAAALNKSYVQLKVRDMLGGLLTIKTFTDTLSTEEPFIAYQVVILEDLFGIIFTLENEKNVNLYQFRNKEWNKTEYHLSLDAIVTANTNSVFMMDDELLKTVKVNESGNLVTQLQNVSKNVVIHATYRGILLYDDNEFLLRYPVEDGHHKWKHQELGLIQLMYDTVDKFQLDEEMKINLLRALKLDMLQFYNSCIILRTLEVDASGIFIIRLKINRFNNKQELIQDDDWRIELGPVEGMRLKAYSATGDSCAIGYILRKNKYAAEIMKCEGPTVTEMNRTFIEELEYIDSAGPNIDILIEKMKALIKYSNRMDEFEKKILDANPYAFDVSLLGVSIDRNGIRTGGKIVSFDGRTWSQQDQKAEADLTLRDKLKLRKLDNNDDTYKIFNDTKLLFDSQTTDSRAVKLVWPHYFATQPNEGSPRIYLFDRNEVVELESHEKLSVLSNKLVVVTTDRENAKLLLRPVKNFLQSSIEVLSYQTLKLNTNENRVTTYKHLQMALDVPSNAYVFTCSRILPGGNATRFGWYEHRYDPVSGELRRIVSDGVGRYIKDIDPEIGDRHEQPNSTTVITDKTGRLPIADIGPMIVNDGEYSYHGFEVYERTWFDEEQRWRFSDERLMTERGNRFLKLENEDHHFEGALHMKRSNERYIFSCWLKTSTEQNISDHIKLITIALKDSDKPLLEIDEGVVQKIVEDWYYVELQIRTKDLHNAITANVSITPTKHMTLCVDHVRFSPMNVDFQAYIYRQPYWAVTTVMHNNGLVTQYLMDPHGNRVVYVSETGKVTDFITYSKAYYIRDTGKLPHVMEIRPSDGAVESFNDSFLQNWKPTNRAAWETDGGYLIHKLTKMDYLKRTLSTNCEMFVIRFVYKLQGQDAAIQLVVEDTIIDTLCKSSKNTCATNPKVPDYGEIVVFVSKSHKAVWFEGSLAYEASHNIIDLKEVSLAVAGTVKISEMLLLYDPSIKLTYYNLLGLPRQTLIMQDMDSIRVKEVLYDEIDRSIITTKWTTIKKNGNLLFGYHQDFITSVESSKLGGLVNRLNPDCDGYPYFRKDYANNPTTVEVVISMPGKTFSQDQKYSRQLSRKSKFEILEVLFPSKAGFTQQVETRQSISYHITISNAKNQKVAYYIEIDDFAQRMTTYQYDGDNLILELPPMYHAQAATFNRTKAFWSDDTTAVEKQLQDQWGIRNTYNDKGQILSKRMPDSGVQNYVYDGEAVRFLVHTDGSRTDKTVFLSYGASGKIVKEAIVEVKPTEFHKFLGNSTTSPESPNYVEYYHGEFDPSPNMRHRSQQSIRRVHDKQMMESLFFDNNNRITKKVHVVPALNTSFSIDYEYLNDKLIMVRYPVDVNGSDFKLQYAYNNAGDMVSIGTLTDPERFAKLQYNADGLVQEMQLEPWSHYAYKRNFSYNEPGYLKKIADIFLEENVSYLEADGYGSAYSMIFEGLISKTSFIASWHQQSNPVLSKLQLSYIENINKTQAQLCLTSLSSQGYYDGRFHPLKSFYMELDDSVGEACRSKQFRKAFHANEFPIEYGHSYDYDSHEQLVKAKYFQSPSETFWKPLVETTFSSTIHGIDKNMSSKIWADLMDKGFITSNCYNSGMCEGVPGKTMLSSLVPSKSYIQALLLNAIAKVQTISPVSFAQKCAQWADNSAKIGCADMWKHLLAQNFVGAHSNKTQNALDPDFRKLLNSYTKYVPQIVQTLHQHFATRLGKSPGDVLSCQFDANGNHRLFSRGFDQYLFTYKKGTNQIDTVRKSDIEDDTNKKSYRMEHNSEGSVTIALHKDILKIEYDPLLNRPSRIKMVDGRELKFEYDVRGERTFKQVLDKYGNVCKEKYYIRDLNRNVLVDLQLTFVVKDKAPDIQVTSYVYSDRGLVGFVRNNEFYSVFTDHEGSTRLVIKNGEVKAAYDYLPFGVIFRKSEKDLDGTISYLYTGQEWDEETGLYNYHTRLYDPEIGRFYQIDPKNQYASPYIYAGNSPVALVDPDGQFFMLLIAIALAIVGAYLGAAAANGAWNPAEWDWRSTSTWLGIFSGALAGASLPFSMGSTLTYLTTTLGFSVSSSVSIMLGSGIGFTYLSMAAANNDWDSSKWDMKSPITWNAFFLGVSTSVVVLTNPNSLVSSYTGISSYVGKGLFIGGKIVLTTGFAYMFGVIQQKGEFDPSKWDFSKPGLYMSMFNGAMQATSTVNFVTNLPKNVENWGKKICSALDRLDEIDAFIKYNRHLGADWSKKLSDARYFLKANHVNINMLGKTTSKVFLYSTISSLRISKIVESSAVPEFGIMLEFIKTMKVMGSFSDDLVNQLVPESYTVDIPMSRKLPDRMEASEYSTVSSGASKLFRPILDFINYRFYKLNQANVANSGIMTYTPIKSTSNREFPIPNCYQLYDAETENSFIRCYGRTSKVSISFKQPHHGIKEDLYRGCYPLSYNNIPSVSCEGEKSSLLFTAYNQPRIFDFVDGWILLARIMPTAVKSIVNCVRSTFGSDQPRNQTVRKDEAYTLVTDLEGFEELREATKHSRWAERALKELNEDIAEFLDDPTREAVSYFALKERIAALQEDLLESVELRNHRVEDRSFNFKPKGVKLDIWQPKTDQYLMQKIDLLAQDGSMLLQ